MNPLRHFLLVAVLFFAQLAAGAHAVEHATGDEGTLPTHVCELCLAAHDLGSALPSLALPLPVALAHVPVEVLPTPERAAFPPPSASQRGPPTA